MQKVSATEEAKNVLKSVKEKHGNLVFVHSEGCCDGTFPLCMTEQEFYQGSQMQCMGDIEGVPYYMHTTNETYWKHLQIVIDVMDGMGNSFSLESAENKSFIIRAKTN